MIQAIAFIPLILILIFLWYGATIEALSFHFKGRERFIESMVIWVIIGVLFAVLVIIG